MKLLGWMHRKFRQNSSEQLQDFVIEAEHVEEDYEEESSSAISELFHGFLAIGTLGSDPNIPDPSTPTFAISVENITEKETEVTENELKLINEELEKVLGAEAKEEGCNDSSGRNSHVSSGRSSHGSTITLSGKPMEGPDTNGNGTIVCPLQGYLFGSAIELSETTKVAKKEHRTSLAELFQRTKITEENFGTTGGNIDSASAEKKNSTRYVKKNITIRPIIFFVMASQDHYKVIHMSVQENFILHMFHKKVHPASSTATYKHEKPQKNENKKGILNDGGHENGGHMLADEDIMLLPERALSKNMRRYQSQPNPPQVTLSCNDSYGNRECCIKTDGDCKYTRI
ncbi:hypothetical protein CRYUN_Cryun06bG0140400 [Craigia yunnanensis]